MKFYTTFGIENFLLITYSPFRLAQTAIGLTRIFTLSKSVSKLITNCPVILLDDAGLEKYTCTITSQTSIAGFIVVLTVT